MPISSQNHQREALDTITNYSPLNMWMPWVHSPGRDWKLTKEEIDKRYLPQTRQNYFDAKIRGKGFIPTVMPGHHNIGSPSIRIRRTPEGFRYELERAKQLLDKEVKTLLITSFNEWLEATQIEPAREYGFSYLNIIREKLVGYAQKQELVSKLDQIEFRFNRTINAGETGGRKMSIRPSAFEFSDSPNFVNPEFELDIGNEGGMEYLGRGWSVPEESNGRT